MPAAWRLISAKFRGSAFDGEGARLFGGRWNSPGNAVVYVASSRSLAALEMLVHLAGVATSYAMQRYRVGIPEDSMEWLDPASVKSDWLGPMVHPETQRIGDAWLQSNRSLTLAVPSALIPEEPNFLLNPRHSEFDRLQIGSVEAFALDPRLLQ